MVFILSPTACFVALILLYLPMEMRLIPAITGKGREKKPALAGCRLPRVRP